MFNVHAAQLSDNENFGTKMENMAYSIIFLSRTIMKNQIGRG